MSDDIDRPANGIVLAATSTENSRRPTSDEVCEVIANSLGLSSVSIDRELSLIDMGIDSLTAVRLADAIQRKFGIAFGVVDVLDAANCIEVARVCQERRDEKDCHCPELPQPRRGMATTAVPASTSQQDLWTLTRLAQALGSAYHIHFRVRIVGILNRDAIIAAIERIVERHEGLRTHFVEDDDVLYQKVALGRQFSIREVEASNSELDDIHLRSKLNADVKAPFDLTTGPLIRGLLMRLSHHEHVLQVTMHHIVSDGWSVGVFLRELKALYRAFSLGRPDPLPPLSIQYADYSVWQREHLQGQRLQNQSDYWKQTLKGAPALLELPLDYPRPAAQSYEGASVAIELDERLTAGLKKLSQQHNTTLFSTMLAGWAALLSRLSGQDEVVIGMPVANRNRAELEPLIGFFVNTLALRVDVSSGTGTADLLMQVRQRVLAAQMNQDLPFAQVVDAVNPVRAFSHSPIFQVMLAWQNFPDNHGLELHGLNIVPIRVANVGAQTDQFLSLREVNGRIRGALTYATALFNKSSIQRYLSCWKVLLQSMVEDQVTPVQQLQWLPEEQRRRLLVEWNATQAPYPQDKCIHELFEAQVEKTPAATAVVYEERSLSYRELNEQANCLAHYLHEQGVGPDIRVGICAERGIPMIVGLLGILKAGGAYVPLDPSYPKERLSYLLADSDPMLVLADASTLEMLRQIGHRQVLDLGDPTQWSRSSQNLPALTMGLTSRHLAYVIYTSGSTGQPKGVMVEHQALVNYFSWRHDFYSTKETDRFLQKAPFGFDVSVAEIMVPLTAGAMLIVTKQGSEQDATYLGNLIFEKKVTAVSFVPSMLKVMFAHWSKCQSVTHVFCGGEPVGADVIKRFYEIAGDKCRLHNVYGPTETTVAVSNYPFPQPFVLHGVPIGKPIFNVRFYVLGERSELVPIGVTGELFVGGECLARGYQNNEILNIEKFVRNPFVGNASERLYRTGDLVRWLPDGNLEYMGRVDHQVKIRGYRIELGEVESQLSQCAGVREAVVVAREEVAGDKRLVAYYIGEPQEAQNLRERLQGKLPEYMLPAAYVHLRELPLTPSGKLDRKGLPAPVDDAFSHRQYEEPQGEIEQTLADIWQELLGVQKVGRHDNFFELGGHSLLAVVLISRAHTELGAELSLEDVFGHPNLQQLSRRLGGLMSLR